MWNKNYVKVLVGQGISLFANNILYFALSVYILEITNSGTLFGLITALSVIPMIVFMPFGGVIADRFDKKKTMCITNVIIGSIVFIASLFLHGDFTLYSIIVLLISLSMIEVFYTPCVQACIPLIQEEKYLVRSNAMSNNMAYFTNVVGPIIGGVLYGFMGIDLIVICSIICFYIAALLVLTLHIPKVTMEVKYENTLKWMFLDLQEAYLFLKKQKSIFRLLLASTIFNFTIVPFIVIGLPYFVNITLNMSNEILGFASASMTLAAILGGVIATIIGDKIEGKHLFYMLVMMSLSLVPIAIAFQLQLKPIYILIVIVLCFMLEQMISNIFTICENTWFQKMTPNHLLGKVMSFIITIAICSEPLSRAIYGPLFDYFQGRFEILIMISTILALLSTYSVRKIFQTFHQK